MVSTFQPTTASAAVEGLPQLFDAAAAAGVEAGRPFGPFPPAPRRLPAGGGAGEAAAGAPVAALHAVGARAEAARPPEGGVAAPLPGGSAAGFGELEQLGGQSRDTHGPLGVQLLAHVVGVDLEGLADPFEGERPGGVVRGDPFACLAAGPAPGALAQRVEGVLE